MPIINMVYKKPKRWSWNAIWLISKSSMWVDNTCRWAFMSNDWTHFYKALEVWRAIVQYSLSTPYDLSSASQVYSRSTDAQNQIFFDFTWKYLYTYWVKQYTLWTNWDISTATQTWTITPWFSQWRPRLCQVIDSTHLRLSWSYNWAGTEKLVTLANPNDTSSVTMETFTRSSTDRMVRNHNGTRVLFSNYGSSVALQQWVCTTPYDITTLTSIENVLTWLKYPYYAYTNYDRWLVLWTEANTVYYYDLPNS
jgi:hypothetical protein